MSGIMITVVTLLMGTVLLRILGEIKKDDGLIVIAHMLVLLALGISLLHV